MTDMQLRSKLLTASLEFILFESELKNGVMISEAAIHKEYQKGNGKPLSEELRVVDKTLAQLINDKFPDKFQHVPDQVAPCFLSTSFIRESAGSSRAANAIGGPIQSSSSSTSREYARTPQPPIDEGDLFNHGDGLVELDAPSEPQPPPPPMGPKQKQDLDSAINSQVDSLVQSEEPRVNAPVQQSAASFGRPTGVESLTDVCRRPSHETPTQAAMRAFTASVRHENMFYTVLQGSIMNSPEVNDYREKWLKDLRSSFPELYAPMPEILQQLEEDVDNIGPLIEVLQQLHYMHNGVGMTREEFLKVNQMMQKKGRLPYVGARQTVISMIECMELGLINLQGNRYVVHPQVLDIHLWRIPPGLTSNMLRLLLAEEDLRIQNISRRVGILLNEDGIPVKFSDYDVVRQANCWPSLFLICAQDSEQQSIGTSTIKLMDDIPKWSLLLDSPVLTDIPFWCDCHNCTDEKPPCVVPEK